MKKTTTRKSTHGNNQPQSANHDGIIDYNALYDKLKNVASLYYSGEASPMSDAEYDEGVKTLRKQADIMRANNDYDNKWDDLFDTTVDAGGFVNINADTDTVQHELPMMSLGKAYTTEELDNYLHKLIDNGATGFKMQMKLDGQSISCIYKQGRLVQISTRGNGTEGEDISHLIDNPEITIDNMPTSLAFNVKNHDDSSNAHIGIPDDMEIRGELLLTHSQFNENSVNKKNATGEGYNVYRNAGVGIVNGTRKGLGYHASLTFIAYRIIINGEPSDNDDMMRLIQNLGFRTVDEATHDEWLKAINDANTQESMRIDNSIPSLTIRIENKSADDNNAGNVSNDVCISMIHGIVQKYGEIREGFNIPNDGIVIKPLNEDEMNDIMGATAHHPTSQLAYKYQGERVEITISDVQWTVGKQGHLTPTLIYEPVMIDGVRNDRATIHNYMFLKEYDFRTGNKALIERAGGVIPKFIDITYVNKNASRFIIPTVCPKCGTNIVFGDRIAECPNIYCPGRNAYVLYNAASTAALNIKGMGESVIDACIEHNMLTDIPSIFTLTADSLRNLTMSGGQKIGRNADKIISEINKAKNAPFDRVAAALAIPGIARRTAKIMSKHGVSNLPALQAATRDELLGIDGIGDVTADAIINWFKHNADMVSRLREVGVQAAYDSVDNAVNNDGISDSINSDSEHDSNAGADVNNNDDYDPFINGHSFSITGTSEPAFRSRSELREYIENNGGVFNPTPNKHTEYVIGNVSIDGSHGKMKKALEFQKAGSGLRIITPEEFAELIRKR